MNPVTWAVRHVTAVLADRLVEDATVVAEDGVIVSVRTGGAAPSGALDGRGALCLPGLIDSHSDGMEKELRPRPGVRFPEAFALQSFEGRVRAAGVTTVYHGVGFEEDDRKERTIDQAVAFTEAITARRRSGAAMIDHRVLYRLDARDPAGLHALQQRLPVDDHGDALPFVSFEDHTPGQGQYVDTSYFTQWLMGSKGIDRSAAEILVAERLATRHAHLAQRPVAAAWLAGQAAHGRLRLLAHDPVTDADIDEAVACAASVAEFPTTVTAARAARHHGLCTVMGAPNVLRGGSHSGNVSAEALIAEGLCTALASDYMPAALLAAAFVLAARGTVALPEAVRLITAGPAEVVGLGDRGRLEAGARADCILVTLDDGWPTVRAVWHGPQRTLEPIA